jgi:hypothetical protein
MIKELGNCHDPFKGPNMAYLWDGLQRKYYVCIEYRVGEVLDWDLYFSISRDLCLEIRSQIINLLGDRLD